MSRETLFPVFNRLHWFQLANLSQVNDDDYKPLPGEMVICPGCHEPVDRCDCEADDFHSNESDSQLAQQVERPEVSNTGLLSHFETHKL